MQYLLLTGIILSAFHTVVMFSKKNKTTADYFLASWFCFSGMPLFSYYLVYSEQYLAYPSLTVLGMAFPLATGPLLFLYTKYQTHPVLFSKIDLLHFIPLLIVSSFFVDFYFMPFEARVEVLRNEGRGYEVQGFIKLVLIYISGLVYIPWTLLKLLKYKKNLNNQFSNTERINFNWLLYQIIGMAIVWVVILFIQDDRFIFGAVAIWITWMCYFGTKQTNVFGENYTDADVELMAENQSDYSHDEVERTKYLKSTLDENTISDVYKKLLQVLDDDKVYNNPELTLGDLAKLLSVNANHLSQVINSQTAKSFYELINERRIQDFIVRVSLPENRQYTLVALAYDCGFNSKASFNRNFKKITGKTPSDHLKAMNLE